MYERFEMMLSLSDLKKQFPIGKYFVHDDKKYIVTGDYKYIFNRAFASFEAKKISEVNDYDS